MIGGEVKILVTVVDRDSTVRITWDSWLERKSSLEEEDDGLLSWSLSSTLFDGAEGEGDLNLPRIPTGIVDMVESCSLAFCNLVSTGIDGGKNQKS